MFIGIALNSVVPGSAWSPAALGSSLLGWWDAEDASTITQSGGLVSSWRDKVAGYDAVQATGAAQPAYSATGFNSRPVITLDGVDDYLELASVPFPTAAAPCEIWLLADQTALAAEVSQRIGFSYGDAANASRRLGRSVVTGVNVGYAIVGSGGGNVQPVSTADYSGRHIVRVVVDGVTATVDQDGSAGTGMAVVPATATARTRIGAASAAAPSNFYQGGIKAALVTLPLTTAQAVSLRAYLKAIGGIA